MKTIWRPKSPHLLTEKQKQEKLKKDSEYEIAVMNIYADKSLITEEKQSQKAVLWNDYVEWSKGFDIYEEVTPEQQLSEAEVGLTMQVEQINLIRAELKKPLLEVKEKTEKVK